MICLIQFWLSFGLKCVHKMSKYGRCIIIFRTTPIPIHLGSSLLRYPSLAPNETVQQQQLFYNYYWNNNGDETAAAGRPRLTGITAPRKGKGRVQSMHTELVARHPSFGSDQRKNSLSIRLWGICFWWWICWFPDLQKDRKNYKSRHYLATWRPHGSPCIY